MAEPIIGIKKEVRHTYYLLTVNRSVKLFADIVLQDTSYQMILYVSKEMRQSLPTANTLDRQNRND